MIRGDYFYDPDDSDIRYIQELLANWSDEETKLEDLMIPVRSKSDHTRMDESPD